MYFHILHYFISLSRSLYTLHHCLFCKGFSKYTIVLSLYNNITTFLCVKYHFPKTLSTVNKMGKIYLVVFFFFHSYEIKVSIYLYTRVKIIAIPILQILYSKIFSVLTASVPGSYYIELDKYLFPEKWHRY